MPPAEPAPPDNHSLAVDRTVLSNERTYQAWIRTGLSALAAGLGLARFLRGSIPAWILLTITAVLLLFSAGAFLQASWRYCHIHVRVEHLDVDATEPWVVKTVSAVLAFCSLLALVGLLLVELR